MLVDLILFILFSTTFSTMFSFQESEHIFEKPTSTVIIVDGTMLPFTFEEMAKLQMSTESINTTQPTRAINYNTNGSIDYGKYQINNQAWLIPRGINPNVFLDDESLQDEMFLTIIVEHSKILIERGYNPSLPNVKESMRGIGYFLNRYKPDKIKI